MKSIFALGMGSVYLYETVDMTNSPCFVLAIYINDLKIKLPKVESHGTQRKKNKFYFIFLNNFLEEQVLKSHRPEFQVFFFFSIS